MRKAFVVNSKLQNKITNLLCACTLTMIKKLFQNNE
jgi:hypothetical protein